MPFTSENQPRSTAGKMARMAMADGHMTPAEARELARELDRPSKRKSKLLGGLTARAGGEAVIVAAVLAVVAFWQGDVLSEALGMYLDDAKAWPADGVLAVLGGLFLGFSNKVKLVNKIRFVPGLIVYGVNSINSARGAAGLSTM